MSISLDDQMIRRLMSKHWKNAPRKKFRGQRAHFRRLFKMASSIRLPDSDWFNYHHYHVDWGGRGNLRWDYRKQYLSVLGTMFRTLAPQCERSLKAYELFIDVNLDNRDDTGEDALYIHTPNQYGEFPCTFTPGICWELPKSTQLLQDITGIDSIRVGAFPDMSALIVQSTLYGVQAT